MYKSKYSPKKFAFQSVKKHRGKYFIRYEPAREGNYFASLILVFLEHTELSEIANRMEQECTEWIQRYSVPLMVTSFDDTDTMILLKAEHGCDHLTGIPVGGETIHHWRILADNEFPEGTLTENQLQNIYNDIPFNTLEERQERASLNAQSIQRGMKTIRWVLAVRVIAVAIFEALLGLISAFFSISKAVFQTLKTLGYVKKSKGEQQKVADENEMKHHHYHCEQNPEEFMKLKVKNLTRLAREDIHNEAREIKRSQTALSEDNE
jgi:hypothetical protein